MYLDTLDTSDIKEKPKSSIHYRMHLFLIKHVNGVKKSKSTYSNERMLSVASFFNPK